MGAVTPALAQKDPNGQGTHDSMEAPPMLVVYIPATQLVHETDALNLSKQDSGTSSKPDEHSDACE